MTRPSGALSAITEVQQPLYYKALRPMKFETSHVDSEYLLTETLTFVFVLNAFICLWLVPQSGVGRNTSLHERN
jgi:hypothetical protein